MLDRFLGWFVIFAPVVLPAVFILIPGKAENRGAHIKWRWALLMFGLLFSGAAWRQQSRAANAAVETTNDAINRTSDRVAAEVKKADKNIIDAQNLKIDQLQKSLDAQGKDMGKIGASPFLNGKRPVQVEITNQQGGSPTPVRQGHLTVSQEAEVSTRPQFPHIASKLLFNQTSTFPISTSSTILQFDDRTGSWRSFRSFCKRFASYDAHGVGWCRARCPDALDNLVR